MTILGFFARSMIALAVILGPEIILQIGATIISEAITLTNFFGTQLSGGRPYSYLWLFGAYLSRSDVTAVNVFSLLMLAPFSLLGLLTIAIVNFLRSAFTIAIIAVSPFWMIDLLYRTESKFFNRSLLLMMRLYLIPILTLITLMFLFLFFPASTDLADSQTNFGFFAAILGVLAILIVVIVPIWGANQIVGAFGNQVLGRISKALKGANDSKKADFLEAGMRGEEGLKQFRSDLATREAAREREASDARSSGRALPAGGGKGDPKQLKGGEVPGGALGDGKTGVVGGLLAGGAKTLAAGKTGGFLGAARAAIGAEAGRPRTIAERMKSLQAGGLKGAAVKGLGTGAKLTAWTARTAAEMMVGDEYAATKGYADQRIDNARSSLITRLAAAGVTSTTGAIRTDTAQGRLAAAGLELAGQARSEASGYAAARLAIARNTFMSGVDAERNYLAAAASADAARVERVELETTLAAGVLEEEEVRGVRSRIEQLDAQISGSERIQLESAASMAATRTSSATALGAAVVRLRESAVASELFGATNEARERSAVEAQAAAADAVLRRLDTDIATLAVEERAATSAGDAAGQRAAQRAIAERTTFRAAVAVERERLFDDATRRVIGGDADAAIVAAESAHDAFTAMGRAGGSRAKVRNAAAAAELSAIDEQIGSIDARESTYREMRDSGVILTDAPDFEAERSTLTARRSTLQREAAETGSLIHEATTARTALARWSRAAAGILPDGRPAAAGASLAAATATAGAFAAGALAGAAGLVATTTILEGGRSAGSSIGAALDARVNDLRGVSPAAAAAPLPSPVDQVRTPSGGSTPAALPGVTAPRPSSAPTTSMPPFAPRSTGVTGAPSRRPDGGPAVASVSPGSGMRPAATAPESAATVRSGAPIRVVRPVATVADTTRDDAPTASAAPTDESPGAATPSTPEVVRAAASIPATEELHDDGYRAPDWSALVGSGDATTLRAAVETGISHGDPAATGIGTEGVALLASAEGTPAEGNIRSLLAGFLR